MDKRDKLLSAILWQGFRTPDWRHNEPPPVVPFELFFEGNEDDGSLAPNLDPHPGISALYARFKELKARDDVRDIWVNIYDMDMLLDGAWPRAENVHVLTSASQATVETWVEALQADGAGPEWPYGMPKVIPNPPAWLVSFDHSVPVGYRWFTFCWD